MIAASTSDRARTRPHRSWRGGEISQVALAAVIPVEIEFEVGERVELLTDSSHAVDPALKLATGVPGIRPLQKFGP
jgi:hypothetical protein